MARGRSRRRRRSAHGITGSTPLSPPLIAAAQLRKGSTNSARGAAKLLTDALATVGRAGACGTVLVQADSAYYGAAIIAAARRAGARFSVTARLAPTVVRVFTDTAEPMRFAARPPTATPHRRAGHRRAEERPARARALGVFTANAAWLACAMISLNLTRAAAVLAGGHSARTRPVTVRARLIHTPARSRTAPTSCCTCPGASPWEPGLGRAVPPRPARPPPHRRLTTAPTGPIGDTSGRAGQTGSSTTPGQQSTPQRSTTSDRKIGGGSRLNHAASGR